MTSRQKRAAEKKSRRNAERRMLQHVDRLSRGASHVSQNLPVSEESARVVRRAELAQQYFDYLAPGNRYCVGATALARHVFASMDGVEVVACMHVLDFDALVAKCLAPDEYLAAHGIPVTNTPLRPGEYDAHMLLRVGQHYYVDLTASQFDSTISDPLVLYCADEDPCKLIYRHGDTTVLYVLRPGDKRHEQFDCWKRIPEMLQFVEGEHVQVAAE